MRGRRKRTVRRPRLSTRVASFWYRARQNRTVAGIANRNRNGASTRAGMKRTGPSSEMPSSAEMSPNTRAAQSRSAPKIVARPATVTATPSRDTRGACAVSAGVSKVVPRLPPPIAAMLFAVLKTSFTPEKEQVTRQKSGRIYGDFLVIKRARTGPEEQAQAEDQLRRCGQCKRHPHAGHLEKGPFAGRHQLRRPRKARFAAGPRIRRRPRA